MYNTASRVSNIKHVKISNWKTDIDWLATNFCLFHASPRISNSSLLTFFCASRLFSLAEFRESSVSRLVFEFRRSSIYMLPHLVLYRHSLLDEFLPLPRRQELSCVVSNILLLPLISPLAIFAIATLLSLHIWCWALWLCSGLVKFLGSLWYSRLFSKSLVVLPFLQTSSLARRCYPCTLHRSLTFSNCVFIKCMNLDYWFFSFIPPTRAACSYRFSNSQFCSVREDVPHTCHRLCQIWGIYSVSQKISCKYWLIPIVASGLLGVVMGTVVVLNEYIGKWKPNPV